MRKLCLLSFVVLAAAIASPAATAQRPEMGPVGNVDPPANDICGFAVSTHFTIDREMAKVFSDGSILVTGHLVAEFSGNGKTVTLNISGPGRITPTEDSVFVVGHGVGAGPLMLPDGTLIMGAAAGPVVFADEGWGILGKAHLRLNICDALAVT